MTLPSFLAASISAGVTASAGGAAARIGSAKSAGAGSAVPALSTSRRLNVIFIASSFMVFHEPLHVIPGRREAANPESILRSRGYGSGLPPSARPGMTLRDHAHPQTPKILL